MSRSGSRGNSRSRVRSSSVIVTENPRYVKPPPDSLLTNSRVLQHQKPPTVSLLTNSRFLQHQKHNLTPREQDILKTLNVSHQKAKQLEHYVKHESRGPPPLSYRGGKWSAKYKRSINCKKPKGFSQRQHCKYGRKTKKNMKK